MKPDRPDLEKIRELLDPFLRGEWTMTEGDDGAGVREFDISLKHEDGEIDPMLLIRFDRPLAEMLFELLSAADWLLKAVEDARPIMVDGAAEWDWRRCKDWLREFGGEETA